MRSAGSFVIAVLVAIVAIWLCIALLGVALKLVGIVIGIGLAVGAYFVAERLLAGDRRA